MTFLLVLFVSSEIHSLPTIESNFTHKFLFNFSLPAFTGTVKRRIPNVQLPNNAEFQTDGRSVIRRRLVIWTEGNRSSVLFKAIKFPKCSWLHETPFRIRTTKHILPNTKLVCYSDVHCIQNSCCFFSFERQLSANYWEEGKQFQFKNVIAWTL